MEDCATMVVVVVCEARCPEVSLTREQGGANDGNGVGRAGGRRGRERERDGHEGRRRRKRGKKKEQSQRNANGRAGLDMQGKKYLRRARTVEHYVKAEAGLSLPSAPGKARDDVGKEGAVERPRGEK